MLIATGAKSSPAYSEVIDTLSNKPVEHLYGNDLEWVVDGRLEGLQ
jgi:hypothetical protein